MMEITDGPKLPIPNGDPDEDKIPESFFAGAPKFPEHTLVIGKPVYEERITELEAEVAHLKSELDDSVPRSRMIAIEDEFARKQKTLKHFYDEIMSGNMRLQEKKECFKCDGTGSIQIDNPEFSHPISGTCPRCKGDGYTWETVEVK